MEQKKLFVRRDRIQIDVRIQLKITFINLLKIIYARECCLDGNVFNLRLNANFIFPEYLVTFFPNVGNVHARKLRGYSDCHDNEVSYIYSKSL